MGERGVKVDHATLNRWVIDYSPLIAAEAKKHKLRGFGDNGTESHVKAVVKP